ncbi:PaaI family thioesterase [Nakamurella lactea]|uniref:PaaI family thioesterase n=1 Tax=Nakamurella lactea TaxID=459515 RepID=UPI0003FE00B1|nr:PaaI family thioesterase [Nakamurella lactea]
MTSSTAVTAPIRDGGADLVAAATRRLIDAVVRTGSRMDEGVGVLTDQLNAVTAAIEASAPTPQQRMDDIWTSNGYRRHDPCSGTENPIAPPLTLHREPDGSLRGTLTLGLPYQGPPGLVHGGISALLLDHALGLANARAGTPAVTAELTMRYLRPVPLYTEVTVTARRTSVDGRKIRAEGAVSVGGEPCVAASGLWITTPSVDYGRAHDEVT